MGNISRTLLAASLAILGFANVGNASVLGCPPRPGYTYNPNALLLLNGYVVGELTRAPLGQVASSDSPATSLWKSIPRDEILYQSIICQLKPESGEMRHAVVVVTKTGLPGMLRSYLKDLASEQVAYHHLSGRYAVNLQELAFFDSRMIIPLTVYSTETGWSATASFKDGGLTCHLAVGAVELPHPELRRGEVGCFAV